MSDHDRTDDAESPLPDSSSIRPARRQAMVVVRSGDSDRPPPFGHDLPVAASADSTDEERPTLLGVAPPGVPAELENETADLRHAGGGQIRAETREASGLSAMPRIARVLGSRWWAAAAGCVFGSVATLAIVYARGPAPARMTEPSAPSNSAMPSDAKPPTPLAASAAALPSAQPVASAAGASPGEAEVTRVTLEVFPANAKVTYSGGGFTGPVGEIDVPRGRRVVLQIARKGYVARRLALDGTKRKVAVGLVKQPAQ